MPGKAPLSLLLLGKLPLSPYLLTPHQSAYSRTPAWTGARGSPTYSPSTASPRQPATQPPPIQASFPPLAQTNGGRPDNPRDRVLQSLSGLTVCSSLQHITLLLPLLSRVQPLLFRLKLLNAMRVWLA